jgi:hypothetical protein
MLTVDILHQQLGSPVVALSADVAIGVLGHVADDVVFPAERSHGLQLADVVREAEKQSVGNFEV